MGYEWLLLDKENETVKKMRVILAQRFLKGPSLKIHLFQKSVCHYLQQICIAMSSQRAEIPAVEVEPARHVSLGHR